MVGARASGQNRQRFGQCTAFVANTRTDTAMQLREHNSLDNYLQQINSLDNISPIPLPNNALRASIPLVSTASLAPVSRHLCPGSCKFHLAHGCALLLPAG